MLPGAENVKNSLFPEQLPILSAIYHLPSAIHHLPSAICHPPSAIRQIYAHIIDK